MPDLYEYLYNLFEWVGLQPGSINRLLNNDVYNLFCMFMMSDNNQGTYYLKDEFAEYYLLGSSVFEYVIMKYIHEHVLPITNNDTKLYNIYQTCKKYE